MYMYMSILQLLEKFCTEWFSFIKNNPDKSWDWNYLSMHPYVTMNIIRNNSNLPWNKDYIQHNPNFRWNDIDFCLLRSPDDLFDNIYTDYKDFSILEIENNNEIYRYKGYYDGNYNMSYSVDLSWEKIINEPMYSWRWDIISRNVYSVTKQWKKYLKYNLTLNIINKYINKDLSYFICDNKLKY